jgi:catechol 2,3-dioxygenase-like lactoylglutathione lyase family enzyme
MKNLLLILTLVFVSSFVSAQSFSLEHDHSTIQVENIDKSVEYYKDILQLKEVNTPWPDNKMIRFFEIGNNNHLHIAQVDEYGSVKINKVLHLAFAVKDFDGFIKYLNDKGVNFSNFAGESHKIQKRKDGVRQIYIIDPDGYWIEINDAKH